MLKNGSLSHAALAGTFALLALLVLRMPFERGLVVSGKLVSGGLHAAANATGFGVTQVALTGQRYTSDTDIFNALGLDRVRSMLDFDSRGARERIERLAWIAKAEIMRVHPNRLSVTVTERTPYVVWRNGGETLLADATGRVLGRASPDAYPHLPRIEGDGAAELAATLFATIARRAEVAQRLVSAERVGRRRWTLALNNGVILHLPADREAAALAQVATVPELSRALTEGGQVIDLRIPGRATLRARDTGVAGKPGG